MKNAVEFVKQCSELFDALFVAEQIANNDVELAKFVRQIVKETPKEDRDTAYLAIITYFKTK